ncbi:hypothetical protein QQX98_004436 [Neonectria punicea]|uniref:Clr5 domain-containing protein n=1 Tax=Neonectria punicea TaxID=979145 RepID=A0ABR1H922_9HYPO
MNNPTRQASEVSDPAFRHIPYNARWGYLRETISRPYIEEGEKIAKVAKRMKTEYFFHAQPRQYKYHFRKWNIQKSTSAKVNAEIIKRQAKRTRENASISDLRIVQGGLKKEVNKNKLKRFLNDKIRRREKPSLQSGVFVRWNLPYAAIVANDHSSNNHASTVASHPTSPACVIVNSPDQPRTPSAQGEGASPTTQLVRQKAYFDKANLLIQ